MIDRRKLLSFAAAGTAVLAMPRPSRAEGIKAGLITQGPAKEAGWNRVGYDALERIGKELGAEISNVEADDNPASYEKAFRDYASRGYTLVIGHGFQFADAAREVGPDFPDAVFLITTSDVYDGNVVGVNINNFQPFFVIGALAALRNQKVGFIGGVEVPPIKDSFIGLANGVHYVNKDLEATSVMLGSWSDLALAKEAALSLMSSGAQFLVPDANVAAVGAFQAVAEKGDAISAFGAYGNFTDKAPKNVLGNFDPDLSQGLVKVAQNIKAGTFKASGPIVFGLESPDVLRITYNDGAAKPVTDEEKAKLAEIVKKLVSGEIDPTTK